MILGFFSAWMIYALVLMLHLLVPARWVDGYVRDANTGKPLRYRLNGLRVLQVMVSLAAAAVYARVLPADYLWTHRWESLAGACTLGLMFTAAIVVPAPPTGKGLLADLFLGRLENPQWRGGRVDAKMYLYLAGAILLELHLLSFAAHHVKAFGALSPTILLYVALFSFFVCEYLFFEEVHLYTYDFFAERVGFKLGWGCLTFYPYFYCVGLWSAAGRPAATRGPLWLAACAVVFFSGWVFARGANMQKFAFKTRPNEKAFGMLAPETVSDGQRALLCSGFWGVSRHVNYLGEMLMATGLALSLGRPSDPWPWLYPLYYVALLVPRQADDDRRCAEKYGALWGEYCKRVRWRIVPGVF